MRLRAIAALGLVLTGCASITRGTTEDVIIQFEPSDAQVTTSLGVGCTVSPCTVKVARKASFMVSATRDGYKPATVEVITKVSGGGAAGFAGNIIAGGVVGMGVDAATGATKDHFPNPVIIRMEPLDPLAQPQMRMMPQADIAPQTVVPVQTPQGKPVS